MEYYMFNFIIDMALLYTQWSFRGITLILWHNYQACKAEGAIYSGTPAFLELFVEEMGGSGYDVSSCGVLHACLPHCDSQTIQSILLVCVEIYPVIELVYNCNQFNHTLRATKHVCVENQVI